MLNTNKQLLSDARDIYILNQSRKILFNINHVKESSKTPFKNKASSIFCIQLRRWQEV